MQRIIKDRQVVDDRWHLLPKDATLESVPNSDDVIIPLALWLEHGPALRGRDGGLGVWLDADEEPESIAGDLDRFQVIAVNFPAFTDGAASAARACCASATATRARSARSATCCATSCSSCAAAASTPTPSVPTAARKTPWPAWTTSARSTRPRWSSRCRCSAAAAEPGPDEKPAAAGFSFPRPRTPQAARTLSQATCASSSRQSASATRVRPASHWRARSWAGPITTEAKQSSGISRNRPSARYPASAAWIRAKCAWLSARRRSPSSPASTRRGCAG